MALYDRGYMRNAGSDGERGVSGMGMLFLLIVVNVILFLACWILPDLGKELALTAQGVRSGRVYLLVTAGFLHWDFSHLFFNMWGLYLFGGLVAPHLGGRRFLWLYLIGAVSGNLLHLLLNWNMLNEPLLGASGAVFAVMTAAALLEPNRQFLVFPLLVPLKTRTLVVCYTVLEVILLTVGPDSNIAHLAHLGGVIGGYLCLKLFCGRNLAWDPFRRKTAAWRPHFRGDAPESPPRGDGGETAARAAGPVGSRELDALLDKVSRYGINSLSEYELARLRQAREEMRNGR